MNIKKIIILLLLIISTIANAQKKVLWLNGILGDQNPGMWNLYNNNLTPTNGETITYTSMFNSIKSIANSYPNQQINPTNKDLILVGYSLGGLVGRTMQLNNSYVKGIISAGCPNQGSALIANTISGNVFNVIDVGISKSNTAINNSSVATVFCAPPVSILSAPIVLGIEAFKTAALVGLGVVKEALGAAIDIYSTRTPCTQDLVPGSPYIVESQNKYISVPYINIYGAEDYWQVLRLAGSCANLVQMQDPANLDVSYDEIYFPTMYSALSTINTIQTIHDDVYQALVYPAIFMPWIWATRELVLSARHDWDGVYRYLETDMHNNYAGIVGANAYELRSYCVQEWFFDDPYMQIQGMNKIVAPDQGVGHWETVCYTKNVPITLEHDGVVTSKAVIVPGTKGVKILNMRLAGTNHLEMGNKLEMRELLKEIFSGATYGQDFQ